MENETTVLPVEFDGVFRFTNFTDEDFTAKWNSVEYTFAANKTSPMIIPGETPEGVQSIRKKFARELGEREFYKTPKFAHLNDPSQGAHPAPYNDEDLAAFIQRCLEPLPVASATAKIVKKDMDAVFVKDQKGAPRTKILEDGDSLVGPGTVIG